MLKRPHPAWSRIAGSARQFRVSPALITDRRDRGIILPGRSMQMPPPPGAPPARSMGRVAAAMGTASKLSVQEELTKYAAYQQTSVTLKATLETGLGMMLETGLGMKRVDEGQLSQKEKTLIQIASFLKRELPVRLARRVVELQNLPEGLHAMPSVQRVREWYEQSFIQLRRARAVRDVETEEEFCSLLIQIYERHAPTLTTMARGVHELKVERGDDYRLEEASDVHAFLDKFYMSRIGIRILIGQYLELRRLPTVPGYVGLINRNTSPAELAAQAVEDAKEMCDRTHGDAPEVLIHGRTDLVFSYIPSHLHRRAPRTARHADARSAVSQCGPGGDAVRATLSAVAGTIACSSC